MKNDKLRDMVRSILPSRYRGSMREMKAQRKRAHRRTVRADVRHEDFEETAADLLRDVRVRDIVQWRRDGDKLNHFLRWCERRTAGMARTEALSAVRAILPAGLIGDHAYSHWEQHLKREDRVYVSYHDQQQRTAQGRHDSAVFRLKRALSVDPSLHGRLNAEIKEVTTPERRRLLLGLYDVEAFVRDVWPCPERHVMLRLIEEIEGRPQSRPSHLYALRRMGCRSRFDASAYPRSVSPKDAVSASTLARHSSADPVSSDSSPVRNTSTARRTSPMWSCSWASDWWLRRMIHGRNLAEAVIRPSAVQDASSRKATKRVQAS